MEWALAYGTNTLPATMTKVATFTTSATDGQTDRLIVTTVKPDDDSQRPRSAAFPEFFALICRSDAKNQ